jgi:hypothetical protein
MHAAWFTAAVPEAPTVVLGLRLRPYALGHEILLRRLGSPLVVPGPRQSSGDVCTVLVLAALICSQTFEEACRSIHSPFLDLFLKVWHWRLRLTQYALRRPTDWPAALARFAAYRAAGCWAPEINRPKTGRTLQSPSEFRLLTVLMTEFGLSESDALNLPLARANAYYAAHGDLSGDLDLFGPADQALLDKVAELAAAATAAVPQPSTPIPPLT